MFLKLNSEVSCYLFLKFCFAIITLATRAAVFASDRTVRPSLFRDRISNLTNLFRPEPNRTEPDRIFAFVNLLFDNIESRKCYTHILSIRRHIYKTLELTLMSMNCLKYTLFVWLM